MTLFGAQTHVQMFDAQVQSGSQHFHWGPLVNLWTPELKTKKTEMQEGGLLSVCTSIAFSLRACLVLSVIESSVGSFSKWDVSRHFLLIACCNAT